MGTPFRKGRPSVSDQLRANDAATKFYAASAGKTVPTHLLNNLPPKRDRVKRPVDGKPAAPLEREILADVLSALKRDPRVGFVWRQSSGTFQEGDRFISTGPKGMPDVLGILNGGRFFGIEVKRPGREPDPRQAERIAHFKAIGAVSGYCWSVESALAILP